MSPRRQVFLDIDGTLLVHPGGKLATNAPRGWACQQLCNRAEPFFEYVARRCRGWWLTAWAVLGRDEAIREVFLPHLPPAAAAFKVAYWENDKTRPIRALRADTPWLWLEDDPYHLPPHDPAESCPEHDLFQDMGVGVIDLRGGVDVAQLARLGRPPRLFARVSATDPDNLSYGLAVLKWLEGE